MKYKYKCVEVPQVVITGKNGHKEAIATYEEYLSTAANQGWELDNIDTIVSHRPVGCLAALFGKKAQEVRMKMLIFKKEE